MKFSILLIAVAALSAGAHAAATPECQVRIVRLVTDDIGNQWKTGQLLPVTIMRRDDKGISFCAHGGSCIPRMSNGAQAAMLTNCHPGKAIGGGDFQLAPGRPSSRSSAAPTQ